MNIGDHLPKDPPSIETWASGPTGPPEPVRRAIPSSAGSSSANGPNREFYARARLEMGSPVVSRKLRDDRNPLLSIVSILTRRKNFLFVVILLLGEDLLQV